MQASGPQEKRVQELEAVQHAMFNILDDVSSEKDRFDATQRATFNILDDLHAERERFETTQRASFNILEDLNAEKDRLESTQKAMLNLLDDFDQEKAKVALSLAEKDVLLREIHHRVKNNLQVIASLLSLASGYVKDDQARAAFEDSQNRVKSMALVHETLYQSNDLGQLDFAKYVRRLSTELFRSLAVPSERVTLKLDVVSGVLPVDIAVPCGLILSELVTNSLKHAFPPGRSGTISIGFAPGPKGTWLLSVADDGVGPPVDLDIKNARTLGLRLVTTLSGQIDGTLDLDARSGTRFTVAFPVPEKISRDIKGVSAA